MNIIFGIVNAKLVLLSAIFLFYVSSLFSTTFQSNSAIEYSVPLSAKPQRIAVLPLFAEEMLLEIVGPSRIVGISHEYLKDGEVFSPTISLTEYIQGKNLSIDDIESILAVKPDFVVLSKWDSYYYQMLLPELEQNKIPYLLVDEPQDFVAVKETLMSLGYAVGEPDKAAEIVDLISRELSQLGQIVLSIPEEEKLSVAHYNSIIPSDYTTTNLVYETIANTAGLIPYGITGDINQLVKWSPDLITIFPYDTDTDGSIVSAHYDGSILVMDSVFVNTFIYMTGIESLKNVPAIKNRRIVPFNYSNSQFMLQCAYVLAELAYPHIFINYDAYNPYDMK